VATAVAPGSSLSAAHFKFNPAEMDLDGRGRTCLAGPAGAFLSNSPNYVKGLEI
jgi:hypothetical protein